jgi:hypothetical protein
LFEREHHRRIEQLLRSLNAPLLRDNGCYFGGGTAMALRYGEYRESIDVDFLVSGIDGYRSLRQLTSGADGIAALAAPGSWLDPVRDLRADQYGLRTQLRVDGVVIKFEIVLEARIAFELPGPADRIAGIATLTPLDMATGKLLANLDCGADRWADDSTNSRDLIDLAMMVAPRALLKRAAAKAATAYGDSVQAALSKSLAAVLTRERWLERCMKALGMQCVPEALLRKRLKALQPRPPRR